MHIDFLAIDSFFVFVQGLLAVHGQSTGSPRAVSSAGATGAAGIIREPGACGRKCATGATGAPYAPEV